MEISRFQVIDEARRGKRSKKEEKKIAQDDSKFHFVQKVEGWTFKPTVHASTQAHDRRPNVTREQWKKMHQRVTDKIQNMKPSNVEALFFSKKLQQAYIASVNFTKQTVRIITVLPKTKMRPKPGTVRFIVEGKEMDIDGFETIIEVD